ncbi:AzlC family ABC transporter permease [Pseudomonas vanderleydeniana]|uniref:AzlC family ABC transporter permease n=1 Tax=Pseudomonas vanderleydeniana TaxID=2745495 RepID=A0A9E6TSE7_9PSED|nr:AzlC family ABC transporter permease [Pseudomonas vanderleydeniana]QXI28065.1 AzlC family ABC transporter permease [Pseudomonas vanderleydeniana]
MKPQLQFRDAFQDALPIVISGFVFGLVFGVLAAKAGLSTFAATLMSLLVFAGASQFIAVEQWNAGQLSLVAVVMTTLLVNLRHLLMSLSLRPSFRKESRSRLIPAFALLLIDETWALAEHRFKQATPSLRYFVQAGLLIYGGWVGGTLLGTQLGNQIPRPADFGLDFTFVAMFLSLMVLLWQRSLDFFTWLLSGVIAFYAARLPGIGQASVVIAAIAASALVAALPQPEPEERRA